MTDEAIEGWGIMMGRDPKRLRRLEAKFATFQGQQRELQTTAWRNSPAGSADDGSADAGRGGRGADEAAGVEGEAAAMSRVQRMIRVRKFRGSARKRIKA